MGNQHECDFLIVGGGPSGMAAGINAASEGLKVCLIDSGHQLGGQARESSAIENYPGFPNGITGDELMGRMVQQATGKFCTRVFAPFIAGKMEIDGDRHIVITDDRQEFIARAVLLSVGLSYRRHEAQGIGPLMGRGVYYSTVPPILDQAEGLTVGVVGGANSAGQAVERLLHNSRITVKMIIRKTLVEQMSTYLLDRLRAADAASNGGLILENTEVITVEGRNKLEQVTLRGPDGKVAPMKMDYLIFFIGGIPQTLWLEGAVNLSEKQFVVTGTELGRRWPTRTVRRGPLPYETLPGIFAGGDVREGSTKRISAAAGEGSGVVSQVHAFMRMMDEASS